MSEMAPFKAEYAKSGRAKCQGCKEPIDLGLLRLAKMVQSRHFDGLQPMWYHLKCFFQKIKNARSTTQIDGFDLLRWEDQQKVKESLPQSSGGAGPVCSEELLAEYAKSSLSSCRQCLARIEAGEVRLGIMMDAAPDSTYQGRTAWWYHKKCFIKALAVHPDVPLASLQGTSFQGHADLEKADATDLDKLLDAAREAAGLPALAAAGKAAKGKSAKRGAKAGAAEEGAAAAAAVTKKARSEPEPNPNEKLLKEQAEVIWKFRDALSSHCRKAELQQLLEHNGQYVPIGQQELELHCAEGMTFGALEPCPTCKRVAWEYRADGYHCRGHVNEWLPCTNVTKTPPRTPWQIPEDLQDNPAFSAFKSNMRKRVFPTLPDPPASAAATATASSGAAAAAAVSGTSTTAVAPSSLQGGAAAAAASSTATPMDTGSKASKVLAGLHVATAGKLSHSHGELQALVEELGGTFLPSKLGSHVTCLIATQAEVDKGSKKVQEANRFGVPIVTESWLEDCKVAGKCALLQKHLIHCASAVVEPSAAVTVPEHLKSDLKSRGVAVTGDVAPSKLKMVVKGRAAVDPASEMADTHHVLEEGDEIWNASLANVDLLSGLNSYYKLQILVHDTTKSAALFRSWGRTGTTRGGSKVEHMSVSAAKAQFCELFQEKTGNRWGDSKAFVKHANKFFPLEMDYAAAAPKAEGVAKGSRTKLPRPVQDLVSLLFDVEVMAKAMCEMDLDISKMPLGKLSRRHLEGAYEVLGGLQDALNSTTLTADEKKAHILGGSTRFYTMVPHNFGLRPPPLIDNQELLLEKIRMIEDLLEMEVAARLIESSEKEEGEDPIDVHYRKLATEIVPVERDSEEFAWIKEYTHNTHAPTHSQYSLEVEEVFKISRRGEGERFDSFRGLHNRRLLWHGSRLSNFVGILSEGLRIAPPSAPVTGYMFGKGVYFADMVSKSANYCFTSHSNSTGFLLLADVALGNMQPRTSAFFVEKLPKGYHSTLGQGRTIPDPSYVKVLDDGVMLPYGKPSDSSIGSSLQYNEYIVYDVAQIHLKYLIKMKFNYGRR